MNKILLCVDSMQNALALCNAAIFFAKRYEASITFFNVLEEEIIVDAAFVGDLGFGVNTAFVERSLEQNEEKNAENKEYSNTLEFICKNHCLKQAIKLESLKVSGDFVQELQEHSKDYKLVVLGKMGKEKMGQNIKSALKQLNTPIFLCQDEFKQINHLLFAYDGSDFLDENLKKALKEPIFSNIKRSLLTLNSDRQKAIDNLNKAKELFKEFNIEIKSDYLLEENSQALLDYAKKNNCDAIAMGAYSSGALKHLFFGSFTDEIIQNSHLALLILK